MRTQEEVDRARDSICRQLLNPDISREQKIMLSGLSTALQWVSGIDVIVSPILEGWVEVETRK